MRIGLVSTNCTPVHESRGGSVETLVWLLARGLVSLGHQVTVFGNARSQTDGTLVATLPGPYGRNGSPNDWQMCEWINLGEAVAQSASLDILHSHVYLWGMPLEFAAGAPMVHTLHVMPGEDERFIWSRFPQAKVVGISRFQWSRFSQLHPYAIIHHGIEPSQFTFNPSPQDYICFLGRFTPGKGPLTAIEVAKNVGIPLRLAGFRNQYFDECIKPHVDGKDIEYVGPVGGKTRDDLLGNARALLYPNSAAEPFGLVLIEALMCGTPVVAPRLGAVPEIINDGVTGCTVDSGADLAPAVRQAICLERRTVHDHAIRRFSAQRMINDHAQLYERIVAAGLAH